jgi:hypothetical protein
MPELNELKLELIRKEKMKESLEKNYERRKKFKLLNDNYEREISAELRQLTQDIGILKRKVRSIESEENRRKIINS